MRWWITRILLGLLALVAGLLAAGAIARANLHARFPPTGQLVDVGGYRLHVACQGAGPTVILDAGIGETSLTWARVQPEAARFARVCAYDRAGIGWSDASPKPRSVAAMVGELHALLGRAGLKGPFVLVGHSLGGIISRQYAALYPREVSVSGLVLVDSAHEDQFRRYPEPVVASTVRAAQSVRTLETLIALGLPALIPSLVPLEPRLPKPVAEANRALTTADPKQVAAGRGEIEGQMQGDTKPVTTLGNLPLVVISRGHTDPGMFDASISSEVVAQTERLWTQMQLELTALSSRGRRIVAAKSGHSIQLDQPELVVDAIRELRGAQR